jgi:hypothetical protein
VSQSPDSSPRSTENPVLDWVRALAFGLRDTAKDMLDAGREEAHGAYQEYWQRYDAKTKQRRERRER